MNLTNGNKISDKIDDKINDKICDKFSDKFGDKLGDTILKNNIISEETPDKNYNNNISNLTNIPSRLDFNLLDNNRMDKKDTKVEIIAETIIEPCSKNICWVKKCKKKLGIFGFECKCGTITCSAHRYPYEHSCTIDYKQLARDRIKKNNPVVIADKMVDRI